MIHWMNMIARRIRNDFDRAVWNLFLALTEPFLRPIRKFLPNTGGIDISPIILQSRQTDAVSGSAQALVVSVG